MLKRKITSIIASSALILGTVVSPVLATTTVEVSGNGAESDSTVTLEQDTTTTVSQDNYAYVKNNVTSTSTTGGNVADKNTGGDVVVSTGDATSNTTVTTDANLNVATVNDCNGCVPDTSVTVSGNGFDSDNTVKVDYDNQTNLFQENDAKIYNDVTNLVNSGKNQADQNTGGDVTILTGNTKADTTISNAANANFAQVGSSSGNDTGQVKATVSGNGADSDNEIKLDFDHNTVLSQDNWAWVDNDVYTKANSGKNQALQNTGGDVLISSGDAKANVTVDNLVNFNWADLDCCLQDTSVKIAGNGFDSDNKVKLDFDNQEQIWQTNKAKLYNDVYAKTKSGYNSASQNTGPVGDAPTVVVTGSASDSTNVSNTANANLLGSSVSLPELPVQFTFDLGDLFGVLGF